ncbi:MAG: electron transfer flavoprotein subunit alpha/FixB family protein, partial [Nitrospiraceae bacterium]
MNPILVFCEQREGRLKKVGLECIGEARRLGAGAGREVVGIVIGASVASLSEELARYGASRVLVGEDPGLTRYSSETYTAMLADAATRLQPVAILMGATAMGKDLAPKLAARLKTSLAQDCVA